MTRDSGFQTCGRTGCDQNTTAACKTCRKVCRPASLNRRGFLAAAGVAAAATQIDVLDFASSLFAAEPAAREKPRVSLVTVRRLEGGGCTWPTGTTEDLAAIQALFTKTVTDAAERFGVELDVQPEPLKDVAACAERIQQAAPDGLIILASELHLWSLVAQLLEKRGDIPTVVYANVTGFTPTYKAIARHPRTLMAATEDVDWLATAVRMFRTMWDVKNLKLLHCPTPDYAAEYNQVAESDEIKAIADFYLKTAKAVVEPKPEQVLAAAKHYACMRWLLEKHGANGVTVTGPLCIGARGPSANPACLAVSKLLDEGTVAACQADVDAATCQRLTLSLFGRPGFMGNISADTVENHLLLSHCTSSLKLEGPESDFLAPFTLRDFHAEGGVSVMAAWPIGREVTVIDLLGPDTLSVASGRVVANTEQVAQPPCGGCRTSVEIALDDIPDILEVHPSRDLHEWCFLGNHRRDIINYSKLAGLKVADLTGKPLVT